MNSPHSSDLLFPKEPYHEESKPEKKALNKGKGKAARVEEYLFGNNDITWPCVMTWARTVTEENYHEIPLYLYDNPTCRFRAPRSFQEWISLYYHAVLDTIARTTSKMLDSTSTASLATRCKDKLAQFEIEDVEIKALVKQVFLGRSGPEGMVWGTNILWKAFCDNKSRASAYSQLRLANCVVGLLHQNTEVIFDQDNLRFVYDETTKTEVALPQLIISVKNLLKADADCGRASKRKRTEVVQNAPLAPRNNWFD